VVVAREITKIHEEFLRGTAAQVRGELENRPAVKGEIVLMVDRASAEAAPAENSLELCYRQLLGQGMPRREAMKEAARRCGVSRREAYRLLSVQRDGT
jgi:16S rRNA (cytidine1402-2'-O)-methyltransferase